MALQKNEEGLRFLGIDDGPRKAEKLIGVSYRGTEFMEQVEIVDQGESTEEVIELYRMFKQDIAAVFLDGISFNGFNIANIRAISREIDKPVIAVTSNQPDKEAVRNGLETAGLETDIVDELPDWHRFGNIFIQFSGCNRKQSEKFTEKATLQGNIPEAVRAADLIGNAFQEQN